MIDRLVARLIAILLIVRLDIYRKVPKDLTQPTTTGAVISIVCCLSITVLLVSELHRFLDTDVSVGLVIHNN
jgi:hypothetical protein